MLGWCWQLLHILACTAAMCSRPLPSDFEIVGLCPTRRPVWLWHHVQAGTLC